LNKIYIQQNQYKMVCIGFFFLSQRSLTINYSRYIFWIVINEPTVFKYFFNLLFYSRNIFAKLLITRWVQLLLLMKFFSHPKLAFNEQQGVTMASQSVPCTLVNYNSLDLKNWYINRNTGGPRYPGVCYSQFWLSAVTFLWPEFGICGFSLVYPRFLNQINFKTNKICY